MILVKLACMDENQYRDSALLSVGWVPTEAKQNLFLWHAEFGLVSFKLWVLNATFLGSC